MFWNYHWVRLTGGGVSLPAFTTPVTASSLPYRHDNLYSRETMGTGGAVTEMQHMIELMSVGEKAKFAHMRAIAGIPKAFAAFYLSDAIGSIPYSEAFQARYTNPPNLTPNYDTQEQLYTILESELKASVAVLKQVLPNQELLGTYDLYYRGVGTEAQNWVMAANSLRMNNQIAANGLENVPDIQMATVVPPGTNIKMNVISGRHAPSHSLDFFVSFFIKKKRKI